MIKMIIKKYKQKNKKWNKLYKINNCKSIIKQKMKKKN